MLELSKSGTWRSTISSISCAKPSSVRPMILIGNEHGNSSSDSAMVFSIARIWGQTCRAQAPALVLWAIHVLASRRMRQPPAGQGFAREQLEDRQPAALERVGRARKVNPPDAEFLLADFVAGSIGVRLEPVDPMS